MTIRFIDGEKYKTFASICNEKLYHINLYQLFQYYLPRPASY